jgi:hypothetical protein
VPNNSIQRPALHAAAGAERSAAGGAMKRATSIGIDLHGIGRILFNRNLSVPTYQRSYAWEEEHVCDFLEDVTTAISQGEHEYFIGSIVTTRNDTARAEIADGQQRLATVTILLAAIRDHFYERDDRERADTITGDLLHKKDLKSLALIPKLQLNDSDNEFFSCRVLLPPDDPKRQIRPTKPSHVRIDRAAILAREHLRSRASGNGATDTLTDLVEYLTDSVKVIWVQVPDDTNAFMVFETLNDRGLALAITDLLKNYLFGLSGGRLAEVQHSWISTTSVLEGIQEDNILLTFLRHFWSSREGLIREKDLYADIKRKVSNQSRAASFGKELADSAHRYAAIINTSDALWTKYGDTCRQHMETVNTLRLIQIRPLILSILDRFSVQEARAAIRNLVSWSVRFLIHGGLGSGAIESHNCSAAKEIRAGKITTAAALFRRLQAVIPNDVEFETSFQTCSVSKMFLARYYLRALEQQAGGDKDPELVPNENTEVVNLEHILPKALSARWSHISADEHATLVNRLGNLALMRTRVNAKSGNDSFGTKRATYGKSEYGLTKSVAKEDSWDRSAIDRRQGRLAKLAVRTWPLK